MKIVGKKIHVDSMEFLAAETCNLRCAHCTIASPFMPRPSFPDSDVLCEVLAHLAKTMSCKWFSVVGGEPLLNKQLSALLQVAKVSGMFEKIEISTNGLLLDRMADEVWELIDRLQITWYSNAREMPSHVEIELLKDKALQYQVDLEFEATTRFFRSILDVPIGDENTVKEVFSRCAEVHEWSCHLLYGRRVYLCSRVPTIDKYLSEIGQEHEPLTEDDGLLIDERSTLFEDLKSYFDRDHPLSACRYCLGTSGISEVHRQLSKEEIDAKRAGKKELSGKHLLVLDKSMTQLQESAVRDELAYLGEQRTGDGSTNEQNRSINLLEEQSVFFKHSLLSTDQFKTYCQKVIDGEPGSESAVLAAAYLGRIDTDGPAGLGGVDNKLVWVPPTK